MSEKLNQIEKNFKKVSGGRKTVQLDDHKSSENLNKRKTYSFGKEFEKQAITFLDK